MIVLAYSLLLGPLFLGDPLAAPQDSGRVSPETRAYVEGLGHIADHGRVPERTRLDFSAVCDAGRYRMVLAAGQDGAHPRPPRLEALEQPGRDPSAEDRRRVQAALDGFAEVSTISLHCWENAGYRYFVSGSSRSGDGTPTETTIAIFFDGDGRFDRVVR